MPDFVDTGILIAAFNRRDQMHPTCMALVKEFDENKRPPSLLHDFVFAETINYLVRKAGSTAAREALARLERSSGFRIERITDDEYATGKNEVFPAHHGLSFVDALTVAFMRRRSMKIIHSMDSDFDGIPGLQRRSPKA